jgi:Ser/Thr protein kinase RdoA (MazF antagonist)
MTELTDTAREDYLRAHIEGHYGVGVLSLQRLDRGVFSLHLQGGRRWIARVFPTSRPVEQVAGDADISRFLEQHSFPAERCADSSPVSVLYGRGILVTEYIKGRGTDANERTLKAFGEMLGRLSSFPSENGAVAREAGTLHHYSQSGGAPCNDLVAAASWLAAIEDHTPVTSRVLYESLREQLANADTCQKLPESLIHPDAVLKNLLTTTSNDLVLIDWTGAGRGPRIASLALLIWSGALQKGGWSPRHVDAIVAGYRSHVQLEESELDRLAAVMRIRPLVFACWRFRHAVISQRSPNGSEWWWPSEELIQLITARACAAFRG